MQTFREVETAVLRNSSVNWNNGKVRIQEENSVDPNLAHTNETVGYLAIDDVGSLKNESGEVIGETGRQKVGSEWTTISLSNSYNNPVIIANSLSIDDFSPATVRVRNSTPTSFEVRVEEWSYLDGDHSVETIGYMVIEGSLPLKAPDNYCEDNSLVIDFSDELIALDNTGEEFSISYEEELGFSGTEQLINRNWIAVDICGNKGVATQAVACPGLAIKAKTVLHGALLGSNSSLMRDDLRKNGLIPIQEPYTGLIGFEHVGTSGGETIKEGLLDIEGPDAIVDWVLLELRSRIDKDIVAATAVGLVQRDGDIISNKGDSLIVFPSAISNKYYISVNHRNHICMSSATTYELSKDTVPVIDFTKTETTGIEQGTILENQNTMWSGDLNQDNRVIYQGPNNDVFNILLDVLLDPANKKIIDNFVSNTYALGDFNLDGKVIFQGPDNDRSALLFNTILIHKENKKFVSNFILQITGKE